MTCNPALGFVLAVKLHSKPPFCLTERKKRSHISRKRLPGFYERRLLLDVQFSLPRIKCSNTETNQQDNSESMEDLETYDDNETKSSSNNTSAPQNEEQLFLNVELTPEELREQAKKLDELTEQWRLKRLQEEREANRKFGFTPFAETLNGRLSMFFLAVGLLTEYWTGYTIPDQVEYLLEIFGLK
eukprot:jgi/Galph1/780/GphlegSOOS_G5495.1